MNYARKLVDGSLEVDDIETEVLFFLTELGLNVAFFIISCSTAVPFSACMLHVGDGICRGT